MAVIFGAVLGRCLEPLSNRRLTLNVYQSQLLATTIYTTQKSRAVR
jgi:hypothetical protein